MKQFARSLVRCFRTETKHTHTHNEDIPTAIPYDAVAPYIVVEASPLPRTDDEFSYVTEPTPCKELRQLTKEFPELEIERGNLGRLYVCALRDLDAFKKSRGFGNILYTSACYKKSLKEYELVKLHLTQQLEIATKKKQAFNREQARIHNLAPKEEYVDYDTWLKRRSPFEQIEAHIFASNKKKTLEIANLLTTVELLQALVYLEEINAKTPKNKTRPIIRREINKIIRSRP